MEAAPTPGSALEALARKRQQIGHDLAQLEQQMYFSETQYFTEDYTSYGTVLKGFEGYLTSKNAQARNKNRTFKLEDRLFSLSSTTSPATAELEEEVRAQQAQEARAAMYPPPRR